VLRPIDTSAMLSIQTFSPIQLKSPIFNFHGYLILTLGLMTILCPILAPNIFKKKDLKQLPGIGVLKKKKTYKFPNNIFDNIFFIYFRTNVTRKINH